MQRTLIVGSRGSKLALWQAEYAMSKLRENGFNPSLKIITTSGDKDQKSQFQQMAGYGFFTGELEQALASKEVDLAVHSFKDMPTTQGEGLVIAGVSYREDPADVLLVRRDKLDKGLPLNLMANAKVGTSSARRKNQLKAFRPDLEIAQLRGNVPTRIGKLLAGEYDAIMLAAAGIARIKPDMGELELIRLDPRVFVPAPAQGVLAYEVRKGDQFALDAVATLHDERVAMVVRAERKLLANLDGGCHMPLGAYCEEIEGVCNFWISKAAESEEFPRRVWIENPDPDVLVVEAWHKLNKAAPVSVFISRPLEDSSYFAAAMQAHKVRLQAESLIKFEDASPDFPDADWMFVSSRTAAKMLGQRSNRLAGMKIAAIGGGTARELARHGWESDFVVQASDQSPMKAQLRIFGESLGSAHVIFPGASESLRTAQKEIAAVNSTATLTDIVLYKNHVKPQFEIEQAEVTVLTSPMNVKAYLDKYPERAGDQFVAIGETTAKALYAAGAYKIFTSRRPSETAMTEAVFSV